MTDDPGPTLYMQLWELQHGRPVREAVLEAVNSTRSTREAARSLGITHQTLRNWMRRMGVRSGRTYWLVDAPDRATDDSNETPLAVAG